ncbi:hypothetical protein C2I18_02100 [Paenibacillus sp. PK3_47]|nr:hypothetical protein C2I18_02100 [Paenibacillus sp. PK3_47]
MQIIIVLAVCYGLILMYPLRFAVDVFQVEWNRDKSWLIKKIGCLCGTLVLLAAVNGLIFKFNGRFADRSTLLYFNSFCSAVALSAAIGFFSDRRIFSVITFLLYLFDVLQFNNFAASMTGDALQDSGIGLGGFINFFINAIVFVLAMFADHMIELEEPDDGF